MKKTLLSAAAIIIAGVSSNAQTLGTPPSMTSPPNAYGNIDASQSTYTQTPIGGVDLLTLALDATPHVSGVSLNPPPVNTLGVGKYGVSTGIDAGGRSFWNYDFAATSGASLLQTYIFALTVVNENNGLTATYDPSLIGDNNHILNASGQTIGNSESLDFTLGDPAFFGAIGYDPTFDDAYDVTLTATSTLTGQTASDSIEIIAGAGVPDATSTMGLMSVALAGLGLVSRRFRK